MEMFVWNMSISFQLLFIIVSGVIFLYLREKSFKYYGLYNIFLIIYVLSRSDDVYYGFQGLIIRLLGHTDGIIFVQILNFFIQIVFYSFYSVFAFYFLDFEKNAKKYFKRSLWVIKFLAYLFFGFAVLCFAMKNSDLFTTLYIYLFIPVMLIIFVLTLVKAIHRSGKHKFFFLIGVSLFVCCALMALAGSFIPSLHSKDPIKFFFVGNILETIFFSLGLAHKVKLINDERNRVNFTVTKHRHQQQISKLHGLLEGEEKERKRMAEELHDGIAGDLSAIKYNLAYLRLNNQLPENENVLHEVTKIIDKACIQIREISHNLSPSSITNFGLIAALENYCMKIENVYGIPVAFKFAGERIDLSNVIETHIYRIVQELVNNIIKHAEAGNALVEVIHHHPYITVTVRDDGKGFVMTKNGKGIGLGNIDSRIRFMNAKFTKLSTETGSIFRIDINLNNIPET
ncbi:7TM diverse intracellular signaling domain-containing protein [Chryseobacterium sp. HSC-36S06]|uniref:sensor histidine kinase n=1 Tax=Chryseobacterium sp. HSC-36S06 TaxID=2910970 RepID=UPI00209DEF13|nr:7TM diverse intracellular signaling domain-containing protein [Chryseobacterium sp. HSC-36S06]MCP2038246.1 signal transduction histidine kinase [Chryseobacterium sp. HSC-36S06]